MIRKCTAKFFLIKIIIIYIKEYMIYLPPCREEVGGHEEMLYGKLG